jgi:dTDP-glucose pyrophosphorylase
MKSLDVVITMAGRGSRFRDAGYTIPKYEIVAQGRSLFEWSLLSLSGFFDEVHRYIFIVRRQDNAGSFIKHACKTMRIVPIEILEIDQVTSGQAATALLASSVWAEDNELLIYNIDTYIEPGIMNYSQIKGDGFIPCFDGPGDHWSFVKLDETGRAVEVKEKVRISRNCTVGAYFFRSARLYKLLYEEYYINQLAPEKEQYVAPLYNQLIHDGGSVYISSIPKQYVHVLGTPEELNYFVGNHKE